MPNSLYAIDNGKHRGIFWSLNNFQNRCPHFRAKRFYTFAEAFDWITDYYYSDSYLWVPPDDRCYWSYYTSDGIPIVFTDGSAYENGPNCEMAGYGIFWGHSHRYNICAALIDQKLTSNRAELMAAIVASKQAYERDYEAIHICTDSRYVETCCFDNMREWKRRGWRLRDGSHAQNVDYLERWIKFLDRTGIQVTVEYVHAHQNDDSDKTYGNNMADWLAKRGRDLCQQ